MKPSMRGPARFFLVVAALTAVAITGCSTTPSREVDSNAAERGFVLIRETTGRVEVATAPKNAYGTATQDQRVEVGHSIRTGSDSTADLYIPDVGTMRLTPSTTVHIRNIQVDKTQRPPRVEAEFELPEGRIQGNTLTMSSDSAVKVRTPKGHYLIK